MLPDGEKGHLDAISIIERVGSAMSLSGCLFIIFTFCYSRAFRKPINRLVFYASFGNMMSVVGTLIARTHVSSPDSFGCQFQGVLIQMFLPADAFWTLAMAVNVWLTFYCKYDAQRLRGMEIWYLLLCYGIPFIPAITFVFVSTEGRGRVYGDATLWCWVSSGWETLRIAAFYGPVWVAILLTFFIYGRAGGDIYKKRKLLRDFSSSHNSKPFTIDNPFSVKTTEVTVTSEVLEEVSKSDPLPSQGESSTTGPSTKGPPHNSGAAYFVSITADASARENAAVAPPPRPITRDERGFAQRTTTTKTGNADLNSAAWSYTKCALLFFTALLITWIPSSANRVYSVIYPSQVSWPLEYLSSIVLPLQGFWNMVIYVSTSWGAVRMMFDDVSWRRTRARTRSGSRTNNRAKTPTFVTDFQLNKRRDRRYFRSESVTELAESTRVTHSSRSGSTESATRHATGPRGGP